MERTPIYNALCSYCEANHLRLHMPGHIGGRGMPADFAALAKMDLTELPGLDDLHLPQGIIAQSQRLLAQAAGAEESFFLVNGASSGIHALILSVTGDGDRVLIPRNAHRSFFGGLVLSGALPVYLPCEIDSEWGLALSISSSQVAHALSLNPDLKAVFITSPSYYGTCSDLSSIVQVAEAYRKPVLVDEAHGGHFPFHSDYPIPALRQGAAAVVNGLHKTWPVFNQGAALHINPSFPKRDQLRQTISILTTTSPSYPLLASMELARLFMEQEGHQHLERASVLSHEYKAKITQIKGLTAYGDELIDRKKITGLDPLKVLISTRELKLNGYQLGSILREKYHIQLEMESPTMIMAMFSLWHEKDDWERLYLALKEVAAAYGCSAIEKHRVEAAPESRMILSPRRAFLAAKKNVPLEKSQGMIAGEIIAAYPPGIPCLFPGELITAEVLDYLGYLSNNKIRIQGPEDIQLKYIKVIED